MSASIMPAPRAKGFRPPPDQQRDILEHVSYERNMLLGSVYLLGQHPVDENSSNEERALHNALLEAFLLHARNLRAFLFKAQDDNATVADVLARDFFANPSEWHRRRPTSVYLKKGTGGLNDAAGKHLAHLSYARIGASPSPPEWEHEKLCQALMRALAVWEELAKKEQPALDWQTYDR